MRVGAAEAGAEANLASGSVRAAGSSVHSLDQGQAARLKGVDHNPRAGALGVVNAVLRRQPDRFGAVGAPCAVPELSHRAVNRIAPEHGVPKAGIARQVVPADLMFAFLVRKSVTLEAGPGRVAEAEEVEGVSLLVLVAGFGAQRGRLTIAGAIDSSALGDVHLNGREGDRHQKPDED